jgi:hypothetical protein
LLIPLVVLGCADPEAGDEAEAEPSALASAALTNESATLCCGTRTTLVEGIPAAENLMISSDQRVFVTGDEGVYVLLRGNDGSLRADKLVAPDKCAFGGITELRGTLYANCYASPDSFLYAAPLGARPSFQRIATLSGITLANGLSADATSHLFVACTGQDKILQLTLSDASPLKIAKQEVWLQGSGLFTNGLKFHDSTLYWTDSIAINSARIQANGKPGRTRTLAARLTFFDDLFVDEQGVLVADWLGSALRSYGAFGVETGATTVELAMPSAVVRAKGRAGFSARALLLTEKGANRVALYEPR